MGKTDPVRRMQEETYLKQMVRCDNCRKLETRMNTLIVKVSTPSKPIVIGNVTVPTKGKITDRRLCRKCLMTHMSWEAEKKNLNSKQKKDVANMTKNIYDGA